MEDEKGDGEPPNAAATATKKRKRRHKKPDAVRYHCNYCRKDISNVVRIKCAQCADFDLCVECFSVGVEIGAHKANHDYHVMDILNFPLFEEEWGADEELLLLEGIEMYGFGNWGDVSDHVGTKSSASCKEHYFNTYINVSSAPLPDLSHILTTAETLQQRNNQPMEEEDIEYEDEEPPEEKSPKPKNDKPNAAFSQPEFAGYMPNRGDFETEYDNEAEMILTDMAFNDDDTPVERDLKLRILEIYNQKLDERQFRKRFIQERNLFEYKKERKKMGTDRDIQDRMRQFARLLTKEEHQAFVLGVIAERNLRRRIEELKKYRKLGIRSMEEIEQYHTLKKQKEGETGFNTRKRESSSLSRENSTYSYYPLPARTHTEPPAQPTSSLPPNVRETRSVASSSPRVEAEKKTPGPKPRALLDITEAPSYDLLSDKERELCSQVRLYPQQYILVKDTLLKESLRQGYLKKAVARQLIKIDVNKTSRIFDFLESSGWINKSIANPTNALPPIVNPPTTSPGKAPEVQQ